METQEKLTPPYLSKTRFDRLIELLSTRSLSDISADYLQKQGLKGTDASVGIMALRFLGIVDNTGKTTQSSQIFHLKGEARQQSLQKLIKDAYQNLFEVTSEPFNLSRDDLTNEFIFRYKLTPRLASSAVPAFLYLCEQSGLKQRSPQPAKRSALPFSRKTTVNKKNIISPEKKEMLNMHTPQPNSHSFEDFPVLNGKLGFYFLKNERKTEIVLSEEFKEVFSALTELGNKFFSNRSEDKFEEKNKTP
jgi:hypothetical protein